MEFMQILGLIGILIAFVVFMLGAFKNVSAYYLAPICALIVALFNGLPLVDSFTGTFISGMADLISTMFPLVLLGTMLGKVLEQSGAVISIANGLLNAFSRHSTGEQKLRRTILAIIVLVTLINYGGIDGYVAMFILIPIFMEMCAQADIPRRLIPAFVYAGVAAMLSPGAPQIHNILPSAILGTPATAGLIPGLICFLFMTVAVYVYLSHCVIKARRNNEHFTAPVLAGRPPVTQEDRPRPNFALSILPLLVVFVLYTLLGLNVSVALSAALLVAVVFQFPYIKRPGKPHFRNVVDMLNSGAESTGGAVFNIILPSGFAAVVSATAVFGLGVGLIQQLPVHPLLIAALLTMVVAGLTASPPAALGIALPAVAGAFIWPLLEQGLAPAVSLEALHRVSTIAAGTFESLPINGMIVLTMRMCGVTHKEGYFPVFVMTVVITTLATFLAALLFILFPWMI